MKLRFVAISVALTAVLFVGCDRAEQTPADVEQARKNAEGDAWRGLMSKLDRAPTDAERVKMLERFIAEHADHPDLPDAERRLEELREVEVLNSLRERAFSGDAADLVTFFLVSQTATFRPQAKAELDEPLTLPTLEGPETFEEAALASPTRLRGAVLHMLARHHPEGLDRPCHEACLNEAINDLVRPWAGGALFMEPGKVDKDVLGALLEKAWIEPDRTLVGATAQQFYAFYRPTVRAFVSVRQASREADVAGAAKTLQGLSEKQEISRFYTQWTQENRIAERAGLDSAKTARNITSWWIRREADGTAAILDTFFTRLLRDYDPSFAAR